MMTLVIDPILLNALIVHAERKHPVECCGILVDRKGGSGTRVFEVVPSPNIAHSNRRRHYQIDWLTMVRTQRKARGNGLEIVGFYHSHPDGSSRPSSRDLADAWPDYSYLILAMIAGRYVDSASWRIDDRRRTFEFEPFATPDRANLLRCRCRGSHRRVSCGTG